MNRRAAKPCTEPGCGRPKKRGHPRWCQPCWERRQPIDVRSGLVWARAAAVPEPLRRDEVEPADCPPGTRWCRGCQCFVLFEDICTGAPRCITCTSAQAHASAVRRKYEADYQQLYARQRGVCAICGGTQRTKRFAVDHDHATGKVRGLLCQSCNHDLLGPVEAKADAPTRLRRAAAYLEAGGWTPELATGRRTLADSVLGSRPSSCDRCDPPPF